ncbi:hypothetical protein AALA90_15120 [Lachnospiraceae bacterium 38-10]
MAIINCSYFVISTKGDIDTSYVGAAGDASYTSYSYRESKGESVRTSLGNLEQLKKENVPAIGGFSDFLIEHNCFSLESIVGVIGLNGEEITEAVCGNYPVYSTQVETPYGATYIRIENYSNDWATGEYLQLKLPEESDAPFSIIYIEEGTYYSLNEDSWGHCIDIRAVFKPD